MDFSWLCFHSHNGNEFQFKARARLCYDFWGGSSTQCRASAISLLESTVENGKHRQREKVEMGNNRDCQIKVEAKGSVPGLRREKKKAKTSTNFSWSLRDSSPDNNKKFFLFFLYFSFHLFPSLSLRKKEKLIYQIINWENKVHSWNAMN